MIVPRPRLLFWAGALAVPLAFSAAGPPASTVATWLFGGFLLTAALDALRSRGRLAGIGLELRELERFSQDRPAALEITLSNDTRRSRLLRVGLALPPGLETPTEDMLAELPSGALRSRLLWPCTPRRRGLFHLEKCHLEDISPLGLWDVRRTIPARCEIRVYPNLLAEGKSVSALFLRGGGLGVHAQRQVGKGREFEKLREYIPGDSFEDIHWRATAKRGRPITKVFQIERTQEVYVILDASRLSARATGAPPRPGLERFVTASLILALAAERQGDLFGLVTYSDRILGFLRARRGREHFGACRDMLYALVPQIVTPDFEDLAAFLRLRLRRRALLVFLTDLDDPVLSESFVRGADLLRRQHLVLVGMLRPGTARPLFSEPDVGTPDDVYRALAGHLHWHNLQDLSSVLASRGVTLSLLDSETLTADLVSRYVGVKRRQIL